MMLCMSCANSQTAEAASRSASASTQHATAPRRGRRRSMSVERGGTRSDANKARQGARSGHEPSCSK